MDHLNIHTDRSSTPANLEEEIQKATAGVSGCDPQQLPGIEETAAVSTAADNFDISAAAAAAENVEANESDALKHALQSCNRALKIANRQERKSREIQYLALARIWVIGSTALQDPRVLVALAKKKKVPTTKASWKNPHIVLLKLIDPSIDDKTASTYARALNFISAAGVPPDKVADFIASHGVVALAKAEAARQKQRKGGGAEKSPPEDPLEAICREQTPVPLPAEISLDGMPVNEGDFALMIIGRREGRVVAWAADRDEKGVAASVRRVLKRTRAATPPAQEDEVEEG